MIEKLRAIEERFWARVKKTETCWLWTGRPDASGYGCVRIRDEGRCRSIQAHRAAFGLLTGVLPGADEVLRHVCDQRHCVCPAHLVAGTHRDNVRDRVERGRCARGERNGRAKLSAEDVREIRFEINSGLSSAKSLSRRFQVDLKTICAIRDGRTWRHLLPGFDGDS